MSLYSPMAIMASAEMERRRRSRSGFTRRTRYQAWQEKYFNDPAGFARDCIRWDKGRALAPYQARILSSIVAHKRVCTRGPRGLGKTAIMSLAILWYALTRAGKDWKVPITASVWRQLERFLLPELHKWAGKVDWFKVGRKAFTAKEILLERLELEGGSAFASASNRPEFIEGAHADYVLVIFDESKAIMDGVWDSMEGASSTGIEKLWLACSTPGEPVGRFYQIQAHTPGTEDWKLENVTVSEVIAAGQMDEKWAESRRLQWGETSAVYKNHVLGEFAESPTDSVIPLAWIEAANERWLEWQELGFPGVLTGIGSDVGGDGPASDRSTIATVFDSVKVYEIRVGGVGDPHQATMVLAGQIGGIIEAYRKAQDVPKSPPAFIDIIGIGAGVVHRLREIGYNAVGYNASKSTELRDKTGELGFYNWRSAGWWLLREMLEPDSGFNICLPPDTDETNLTGDLSAPRFTVNSNSDIVIESKDGIKKRLRRSTDFADAVIHGLVGPVLHNEAVMAGKVRLETHYDEHEIR